MPANKFKLLTICLLTVLGLSACSPFRPESRSGLTMGLPLKYDLYSTKPQELGKWWENFNNTELDALIEQALTADFDVRAAWARLRQLRGTAAMSRADLYPRVNGSGKYSNMRTGSDGTEAIKGSTSADKHNLGLAASYEVDLWGKIEARANSGELDYLASREEVSASAMTVAAEVANRWLKIQTQRQKKELLYEQLKTNLTYLELIELRFKNSLASALDVYQQRENVARTRAQIPPIESREIILLHELAFLLGQPAGSLQVLTAAYPVPAVLPGLGLPFDLLANRPDVRAAGLKLRSADWSVTAARADRLPTLTLSAEAALSSVQLTNIFSGWMSSLAGSLAGPVFDAGRRAAEVDRARAMADEKLLAYKRAVYNAYKEVQDSLMQEKWQNEYISARKKQLEAAKTSLNEAGSRYLQGLEDYLPVLNALLSVQSLEIGLVEDEANLLLYRVSLYRALGGTWAASLTSSAELPEGDSDSKTKKSAKK